MSSRSTTRLPVARLELILAIVLLSAALSIRGKALLGAWYNNLASLALAVDWQGPGEDLGSPGCTTWVASSAAAPAVELALLLDPENRRTRLNAARVAWLGGDCETALDLWSTLESSDSIAHLEHANAVHALGREEEAQALYGQISGVTDYLRVRGERAQALGDTEAALGWYELSMAAAPTLETTQRLAALYVGRQQPAAATAAWQKLAEAADGSDPTYWWAVGQSAELQEDWRAAANAYDRGVDQAADPCRFWEREAASLERLGDWARVEHISRAALDRCPDLLWPYLRLGDALRRQADYTGALQWYGQAELLWPDDVHPKYLIGVLWYDQDDWEQAEA